MPRKLSPEERARRRSAWMNSPRSLNGRLAGLERKLLLECRREGLNVKQRAKHLHTGVIRVRGLIRKHGVKFPSQPAHSAAMNEHNARLHAEKLARRAKTPASAEDSLSPLARLADEYAAQRAVAAPNGTGPEPTKAEPPAEPRPGPGYPPLLTVEERRQNLENRERHMREFERRRAEQERARCGTVSVETSSAASAPLARTVSAGGKGWGVYARSKRIP